MLLKIILAAILSLSVSCFAETGSNKTKLPTDEKSTVATPPPGTSTPKASSRSLPAVGSDKKPSMVDYCKKHTC